MQECYLPTKLSNVLCKVGVAKTLAAEYHYETLKLSKNVLNHCRWFDGFNWEGLRNRSLHPPITPKIQNQLDTSNFDEYPTDADGPPPGSNLFLIAVSNP